MTPPRRRRERNQRGAAMVEFALLLPVFAMLVFGAFSGAQAYNQKLTLVAAAREATRYGATLPINSTATDSCNTPQNVNTWLDCVEKAAVQTATGQLAVGVAGRYICVAYVNGTGSGIATTSAVYTTSDTAAAGPGGGTQACDSTAATGFEPQVQVIVQNSGELQAVVYTQTLTLTGSSVSRYERSTS